MKLSQWFMDSDPDVKVPVFKGISVWVAAVSTSAWTTFNGLPWDKFAQFAAFIYSCALIWEWIRKKIKRARGDCEPTDLGDL